MLIKRLSLRIDETLLSKFRIIANDEGRSANSQIIILIRQCVAAYEKEHGIISP